MANENKIRVTFWNEFCDEKRRPSTMDLYPGGVHGYLASVLGEMNPDFEITTSTMDDPEQGLPDELIDNTDVLIWYSHMRDKEIEDSHIQKIIDRVIHDGMGVIFLHSGIFSKTAARLLGARGYGGYREIEETERVFVIERSHPICDGLPEYFEFPASEMYSEPNDIPVPDELIFISWYAGGNIGRSGYTYKRGAGKVFCFTPGHSSYDLMKYPEFHQVVSNGIRWAKPVSRPAVQSKGRLEALPIQRREFSIATFDSEAGPGTVEVHSKDEE